MLWLVLPCLGIGIQRKSTSTNSQDSGYKFRTLFTEADMENGRANAQQFSWAKKAAKHLISFADEVVEILKKDSALQSWVPDTTAATFTICPHCVTKGFPWHPNGDWSWSYKDPEKLVCNLCGTAYPHPDYPENLTFKASWPPGRGQIISYVDIPPQKCMSYQGCRPAISGVTRGRKLQWLFNSLADVGLAYQLTKDAKYANTIKRVLLRMADVVPGYLIYAGYSYNEYADCDPHYVAKNIKNIMADRSKNCKLITASPTRSGAKDLYAGYWASSRIGTSGMDGWYLPDLALSYDLIAATLTASERATIEEKVIRELVHHLVADHSMNNKAVYNRHGAAISGLALQDTDVTRFGLQGFTDMVDRWWLRDGGSPESPAYAFMVIEGIYKYGYAFRNYSDPDSYTPTNGGPKYTNFNVNTQTNFDQVAQYLVWSSLGNLFYPPIADSYTCTNMSETYAEFLAFAYPKFRGMRDARLRYSDPHKYSIFVRNPNIESQPAEPFRLPDVVFPYLSQGFVRTGENGTKGALIMDASNWGPHHHMDSLNIIYWKEGRELLNDLGYLWDHDDGWMPRKTKQHNTVFIDEKDQITKGRGGSWSIFAKWNNVKVMQASSQAYPDCKVYNRTIVQIEHNESDYIVDIFRVEGGKKQQYIFHGPNNDYVVNGITFNEPPANFFIRFSMLNPGFFHIKDVVLREDGRESHNLASKFPTIHANKQCPRSETWCWSNNLPVSTDRNTLKVNVTHKTIGASLNLGNTDGLTGENAFAGKAGKKYILSCKIHQTANANISIVYWKNNNFRDANAQLSALPVNSKSVSLEGGWVDLTAEFVIDENVYGPKLASADDSWNVVWNVDQDYIFEAHIPFNRNLPNVMLENGWGQRDYRNTDRGATLPYFSLVKENYGNPTTYVAVFEGHKKSASSTVIKVDVQDGRDGSIGIRIITEYDIDYILSAGKKPARAYGMKTDAPVAVVTAESAKMIGGSFFKSRKLNIGTITGTACWSGDRIEAVNNNDLGHSWFEVEADIDVDEVHTDQCIHITGTDGIMRAYPIMRVERIQQDNKVRIYTRYNSVGFRVKETGTWYIQGITDLSERAIPAPLSIRGWFSSHITAVSAFAGTLLLVSFFIVLLCNRKTDVEDEVLLNSEDGW